MSIGRTTKTVYKTDPGDLKLLMALYDGTTLVSATAMPWNPGTAPRDLWAMLYGVGSLYMTLAAINDPANGGTNREYTIGETDLARFIEDLPPPMPIENLRTVQDMTNSSLPPGYDRGKTDIWQRMLWYLLDVGIPQIPEDNGKVLKINSDPEQLAQGLMFVWGWPAQLETPRKVSIGANPDGQVELIEREFDGTEDIEFNLHVRNSDTADQWTAPVNVTIGANPTGQVEASTQSLDGTGDISFDLHVRNSDTADKWTAPVEITIGSDERIGYDYISDLEEVTAQLDGTGDVTLNPGVRHSMVSFTNSGELARTHAGVTGQPGQVRSGNAIISPGQNTIAIGNDSAALVYGAVSLGANASNNGSAAVSLGIYATAFGANNVALGAGSVANTPVGDSESIVSVGDGLGTDGYPATRRITNVTDPRDAQDAATKNYVDEEVATAVAGVLPDTAGTEEGQVLTLDEDLNPVWADSQGGSGGAGMLLYPEIAQVI